MEKFMAAALGLVNSGRITKPAAHMKAPPPITSSAGGDSDWG